MKENTVNLFLPLISVKYLNLQGLNRDSMGMNSKNSIYSNYDKNDNNVLSNQFDHNSSKKHENNIYILLASKSTNSGINSKLG